MKGAVKVVAAVAVAGVVGAALYFVVKKMKAGGVTMKPGPAITTTSRAELPAKWARDDVASQQALDEWNRRNGNDEATPA